MTLPAPRLAAFLFIVGFAAAAAAPAAPAAPPQVAAPALSAEDAWLRVIPGAEVASAYMTLRNRSQSAVTVLGAHSPLAAQAMLHESKLVAGEEQMRAVQRLVVPAGGAVQLKPGGLHLMLHLLSRTPAAGEEVPIVLELEGGTTLEVRARVRPLSAD